MTDELLNQDEFDPTKDYLSQLVGDTKKFKTPEDLAKGKYESDLYINTLTARMDELRSDYDRLRDDYNSRAKLEEVLDQMKTNGLSSSNNTSANEGRDTPKIDESKLSELITAEMSKQTRLKQEEENFKQVQSKLRERFGSNRDALKQHLDDLDLSEDFVKELARKNPKVVLRTLGLDQPSKSDDFLAPPRSNQRRDSFAPKTVKRDWDYYQEIKKKDPELYRSKAMTIQMHKDYEELGSDFETENFRQAGDNRRYQFTQ